MDLKIQSTDGFVLIRPCADNSLRPEGAKELGILKALKQLNDLLK